MSPRRPVPIEDRWLPKVDQSGGPTACHPWMGHTVYGYGHIMAEDQRDIGAHVYAWIRTHGPVPPGLEVDHQCHNDSDCVGGRDCPHRRCCNVAHLRLSTRVQNVTAGRSPAASAKRQLEKTHCPQNHPYDEANTYIAPNGGRLCRTCRAESRRAYEGRQNAT